ncbi:MAG: tetratricopeptide repeat protein [Phycisphaerae bacterium]
MVENHTLRNAVLTIVAAGVASFWCIPLAAGGEGDSATTAPSPAATTTPTTTTSPTTQAGPETKPSAPPKEVLSLDQLKPGIGKLKNFDESKARLHPLAKRLSQDAQTLLDKGDYINATAKLERAVGFNPNNPQLRMQLGKVYMVRKQLGKALRQFAKAAEHDSDNLELQMLLGKLQMAQKQIPQAILTLRTALESSDAKPENPLTGEALYLLGGLLDQRGYTTAALEAYNRLSENIDRHPRAYSGSELLEPMVSKSEQLLLRRGALLGKLERTDKAVTLLKRAYRRDRSNAITARMLLSAALQAERYETVEELLIDMCNEPGLEQICREFTVKLTAASDDPKLPLRLWRGYIQRGAAGPGVSTSLARAALRQGAADDVITIVEDVLRERPEYSPAAGVLADAYAKTGKIEKGLQTLADTLNKTSNFADAVPAVTRRLAKSPKVPENADRQFARKAMADDSEKKPWMLLVAGHFAHARGRDLLAADQFQRATRARKHFRSAYDALLEIHLANRRYDRVEKLLDEMEKSGLEEWFIEFAQGKAFMSQGKPGKALASLRLAHQANPTHLPTLLLLAEAAEASGEHGRVEKYLVQALTRGKTPDIHRRLFNYYIRRKRKTQARTIVGRLIREHPDSPLSTILLIEYYIETQSPDKALPLLEELAGKHPSHPEIPLLKAKLEIAQHKGMLPKKDFEQAVEMLRKAIASAEDKPRAMALLAELLNREGKHAEAAGVWSKIHELRPGYSNALQNAAESFSRAGQHAKALQKYKDLVEQAPNQVWYRLDLLNTLVRLDQYDKAVELGTDYLKQLQKESSAEEQAMQSLQMHYLSRAVIDIHIKAEEFEKGIALAEKKLQGASTERQRDAYQMPKLTMLARSGKIEQALEYADDIGEEKGSMRRYAIYDLIIAEKFELAEKMIQATLKDQEFADQKNDFRELLLWTYGNWEKTDQAVKHAGEWLKEDPTALQPRQSAVMALQLADKNARAEELCRTWLKDLIDRRQKILPAVDKESTEDSDSPPIETFTPTQKLARINKAIRWCRRTIVSSLMGQNKYRQAAVLAEEYLRLPDQKDSYELMVLQATALENLGKGEDAVIMLRKALETLESSDAWHASRTQPATSSEIRELRSTRANYRNNLAYTLAEMNSKLDEAEQLIRLALAEDRTEPVHFIDTLAWIYYKQEQFGQAGTLFQAVLNDARRKTDKLDIQEYQHPVILEHAGDTLYRLGWTDEAVKTWKWAAERAQTAVPADSEGEDVAKSVAAKIKAVEEGKPAPVAPTAKEAQGKP